MPADSKSENNRADPKLSGLEPARFTLNATVAGPSQRTDAYCIDRSPVLTALVALMTIACFAYAGFATYAHQATPGAARIGALAQATDRGCAAGYTGRMARSKSIGCEFARLQSGVRAF